MTDDEAYELFARLRRGLKNLHELDKLTTEEEVRAIDWDRYKDDFGEKFRASEKYYALDAERAGWHLWQSPTKHRLPIDDVIDQLRQRTRKPNITIPDASNRVFRNLRLDGPYKLSRIHLELAISQVQSPTEEREYADQVSDLIDDIDKACIYLLRIANRMPWKIAHRQHRAERHRRIMQAPPNEQTRSWDEATHIWKAVTGAQRDAEKAVEDLFRLRNLVSDEYPHLELKDHLPTGRIGTLWNRHFVERMANLWRQLTGHKISKDPAGLFSEFVEAAWYSYDERMPPVSFARVIREIS
ncbi:MAG TPA: hypothetical protein VIL09_07610 [Microvirga sp.]